MSMSASLHLHITSVLHFFVVNHQRHQHASNLLPSTYHPSFKYLRHMSGQGNPSAPAKKKEISPTASIKKGDRHSFQIVDAAPTSYSVEQLILQLGINQSIWRTVQAEVTYLYIQLLTVV
jgi:hypothetical protein